MSSYPGDPSDPRRPRRGSGGAQGASRGGSRPDDGDDDRDFGADPGRGAPRDGADAPFGGYPFDGERRRSRTGDDWSAGKRRSAGSGGAATFLGLPVKLIYAMGGAVLALVLIGAVCGRPTANGSVAGQVKALGTDRAVSTVVGAQLTLNGNGQTFSTTSTNVPADAEGDAAYNYRFENVPPGTYAMSVTPPAGSNLQPEENITFEVKSGQLYPQSVMLLAQGIQKPRVLAANELRPGEGGGYVNERGERVVYQQGGGFDATDALLLYLLWRNPPVWGYGAPPVIISSPGGPTGAGSSYRVEQPPSRTSGGQTITRQPSTPGQGSTRPSSGFGATGAGPGYSSGGGARDTDVAAPSQPRPSTGTGSGSSTQTQTRPSTSTGSQGASRPSSSTSSPSRSTAPSRSSGSSGGGRR